MGESNREDTTLRFSNEVKFINADGLIDSEILQMQFAALRNGVLLLDETDERATGSDEYRVNAAPPNDVQPTSVTTTTTSNTAMNQDEQFFPPEAMRTTACPCNIYDPNLYMIHCDNCNGWFHGKCVGIREYQAIEIDRFYCPACQPICGLPTYKPILNNHRYDFWDSSADNKPVQTGTEQFLHELHTRHFMSAVDIIQRMTGNEFTLEFLKIAGFNNPVLINKVDHNGLFTPPKYIDIETIATYVGETKEVDVIDTKLQRPYKMSMDELVEYYKYPMRMRTFNCISLEFSDTSLAAHIDTPIIVRQMDWAETVWPNDPADPMFVKKPRVQKYCLISAKNSFTDFHIDFGGSSVWYHVVRGQKVIYLIKPTKANLDLYERWVASKRHSEMFFGDHVDHCYRLELMQGQTFFLPTGWIHAVFTPVDSIVFGGNFLHNLNIPLQLQVYDIEKRTENTMPYLYPCFETINWYAAKKLMLELHEYNAAKKNCPQYLLTGLRVLLGYLKIWNAEKFSHNENQTIPGTINGHKLLKDLNKELRNGERIHLVQNPPKPERESKRKKRRPINNDFIEYSNTADMELINWSTFAKQQKAASLAATKAASKNKAKKRKFSVSEIEPQVPQVIRKLFGKPLNGKFPYEKPPFGQRTATVTSEEMLLNSSNFESNVPFQFEPMGFNYKVVSSKDEYTVHNKYATMVNDNNNSTVIQHPTNGIESLLKASSVSSASSDTYNTREAIAGMLSMGSKTSVLQPTIGFKYPSKASTSKRSRRQPRKKLPPIKDIIYPEKDHFAEKADDNVHQDDEYIYPSLELSDDEQTHIYRSRRSRGQVDESWNPGVRVGPLTPKVNRPVREGTKKSAVQKVLKAAASHQIKSTKSSRPKRIHASSLPSKKNVASQPSKIRATKAKKEQHVIEKSQVPSKKLLVVSKKAAQSAASKKEQADERQQRNVAFAGRKGFKTVKQRLGKILKLHRMMR